MPQFEIEEEVWALDYKNYGDLLSNSGDFETLSLLTEDCRKVKVKIIGQERHNRNFYLVLVPPNSDLNYWTLKDSAHEIYDFDSKYCGYGVWNINQKLLGKIEITMGFTCISCQEYCPYGIANQPNGTFACWVCRHDPRKMLES